jgi:hypothetical protein
MNRILHVVLALFLTATAVCQRADQRTAKVGSRARIEQLVLPGPLLAARAITDTTLDPIVLRVLETWPHGAAADGGVEMHRYDLEWVGLEPGEFDLADWLVLASGGSEASGLPPIPVTVESVLGWDQVEPNEPADGRLPELGGYRSLLLVFGFVWAAVGVVAFVWIVRRRAGDEIGEGGSARPRSLAERLRPRVEAALRGELDGRERAELERLLLGHWRQRLGLGDVPAASALASLRAHPEAGELLRALERWLHSPDGATGTDVDALLRPYQDVRDEAEG